MTNNKSVSTLSKIISLICSICVVGLFFVATILGIVFKVKYGWSVFFGTSVFEYITLIAAAVLLALYLLVFNKKQSAKLFCALPLIVYSVYLLIIIPGYFKAPWLDIIIALLYVGTLAMMVMAVVKVFTGKKAALFATIGAGINAVVVFGSFVFQLINMFSLNEYYSLSGMDIILIFYTRSFLIAQVCFVAAVTVALWGTKPFSTAPATVQQSQSQQTSSQLDTEEEQLIQAKKMFDAGLITAEQYKDIVRNILSKL